VRKRRRPREHRRALLIGKQIVVEIDLDKIDRKVHPYGVLFGVVVYVMADTQVLAMRAEVKSEVVS
jgi:hypothetical protein